MSGHLPLVGRWLAMTGSLVVVMATVAAFADWPRYQQLPAKSAVIKLSFTHGSNREAECRRRTPEELSRLPPNMRKPLECPRRRGDVQVELELDDVVLYRATLPPAGISGDGPARVYRRFVVPAGPHAVAVRMRDTPRARGFDHARADTVVLTAGQSFVIDFGPEGFVFR